MSGFHRLERLHDHVQFVAFLEPVELLRNVVQGFRNIDRRGSPSPRVPNRPDVSYGPGGAIRWGAAGPGPCPSGRRGSASSGWCPGGTCAGSTASTWGRTYSEGGRCSGAGGAQEEPRGPGRPPSQPEPKALALASHRALALPPWWVSSALHIGCPSGPGPGSRDAPEVPTPTWSRAVRPLRPRGLRRHDRYLPLPHACSLEGTAGR